jgi:hypothetical protein
MRETTELPGAVELAGPAGDRDAEDGDGDVGERIRTATPGLATLVAEAQETWLTRARDGAPGAVGAPGTPGWRPFEDAFPTFYQFTNKPR